jgi:hypothetical protein
MLFGSNAFVCRTGLSSRSPSVISCAVFGFVGIQELLDLANGDGEELVHLLAGGESRAPAGLHVLHASEQATLTGVRIAAELNDEDAGSGV